MSHLFSNTNINITNTRLNILESELSNSTSLLTQLSSDIDTFTHKMELSFIKEELDVCKMQNTLLQLKYELLLHSHNDIIAQNKAMTAQLDGYMCSICLTKAKDCILEPCGHFVGCMTCINLLPDTKCPVCRTDCNYYIRVFNS